VLQSVGRDRGIKSCLNGIHDGLRLRLRFFIDHRQKRFPKKYSPAPVHARRHTHRPRRQNGKMAKRAEPLDSSRFLVGAFAGVA
jgi:hypothetical protein